MKYISLTQYCEKYGYDRGNAFKKMKAGRIDGAILIGKTWAIPADAPPFEDARVHNGRYRKWRKGGRKGAEIANETEQE